MDGCMIDCQVRRFEGNRAWGVMLIFDNGWRGATLVNDPVTDEKLREAISDIKARQAKHG